MSYEFPDSADFLDGVFSSLQVPISIVAWVWRDSTAWDSTSDKVAAYLGTTGGSAEESMRLTTNRNNADRASLVNVESGSVFADENFTANLFNALWVPIIAVNESAIDHRVYVGDTTRLDQDVGSKGIGTALTIFRIGANQSGFNNFSTTGTAYIAEVAVFDEALTDSEINAILTSDETGPAPNTIRSADCIGYWPLDTDQTNHTDQSGNGGPTLTVQGSALFNAEHPTITAPAAPIVIPVPTGPLY